MLWRPITEFCWDYSDFWYGEKTAVEVPTSHQSLTRLLNNKLIDIEVLSNYLLLSPNANINHSCIDSKLYETGG